MSEMTLAEELEEAAVAAVAACGVDEPFVVRIVPRDAIDDDLAIEVGGRGFRDRVCALAPHPQAMVSMLWRGAPPDAWWGPLPGAKRDRVRADDHGRELERELGRRLNAREWPGACEPFLALVSISYDDEYAIAEEVAGSERVAAFCAALRSRGVRQKVTVNRTTDRAGLAAAMTAAGLGAHAQRLAHEVATVGLRLEPARDASSRLAGPGLLPVGLDWPDGMTFLAALSLSELGHPPLPVTGWLLFFLELEPDQCSGWTPDAPGLVLYADEVEPANGLCLGPGVPVAGRPQLTLPDGYDSATDLGLDFAEREVYDEIAQQLNDGCASSTHWVLGHATAAQGHSNSGVLLLHLADTEALGMGGDGSVLQFRIDDADLAAGRWERAEAYVDF